MYDEVFPWDEPLPGHHTEREYPVRREHGPPRHIWNADPMHRNNPVCPSCGYCTGHANWVKESGLCFPCHLIANDPDAYRRYWNGRNAPGTKEGPSEPRQSGIKKLGG